VAREQKRTEFERWFTRTSSDVALRWLRVLAWSVVGYGPLDRYLELKASRALIIFLHLLLAACDIQFYLVARLYEQPHLLSLSSWAMRLRLLILVAGVAVTWFRSVKGTRRTIWALRCHGLLVLACLPDVVGRTCRCEALPRELTRDMLQSGAAFYECKVLVDFGEIFSLPVFNPYFRGTAT
jgi:hypothetical protein